MLENITTKYKMSLNDFKLNPSNISAFITAGVFGVSGAFILYANVASQAGMTNQQAVSWIMSGNFFGAIATIFLALYYRQPIVILPSLPALVVMGPMFLKYSIPEMIGGYIIAGVIIFVLGKFKIVGKLGEFLPIPIIMGMIAGVFIRYGTQLVDGVINLPTVGGLIILAYLVSHVVQKKIPPLLITLVVAIVATLMFVPFDMEHISLKLYPPVFILPQFDLSIIMSVSVPLVLLVVADTLKGFGVLKANGYDTPLNTNTMVAGVVSIIASFFLCHAVSLAGPITAIVGGSEAGDKKYRFVASVLNSIIMIVAGITAGLVLPFVIALPSDISHIIAGLAMIGLFTSSMELAFGSRKYLKGAFTSFIIGMSGITLFNIGAPVLAIVIGIIVSISTEGKNWNLIKVKN